jgi:hypothetical protein
MDFDELGTEVAARTSTCLLPEQATIRLTGHGLTRDMEGSKTRNAAALGSLGET